MDAVKYTNYWTAVKGPMQLQLEQLLLQLKGLMPFSVTEIYEGGDEEFKLSVDIQKGNETILGVDFVLTDADVHGEEVEGVGVMLTLIGRGGQVFGGYSPANFTECAFTAELSEAISRVEAMNVTELARYIVMDVLESPAMKEILASV